MSIVMYCIFDWFMDEVVLKGFEIVIFGMGCYWGVECLFWQFDGVWMIEVGFVGGYVENFLYKQVCEGLIGYVEVVCVVFDFSCISFEWLLQVFWENYNLMQGNWQGNDVGFQYCSVIMYMMQYQKNVVELFKVDYGNWLVVEGFKVIIIEIVFVMFFYFVYEDYQ